MGTHSTLLNRDHKKYPLLRVAFPTRKRHLWYNTKSRFFLVVVFENFQNLSLKCLWDGSGVGCNVA